MIKLGEGVAVTTSDGEKSIRVDSIKYTLPEGIDETQIEKDYPESEISYLFPKSRRRYKKVLWDISDEEYEILKKFLEKSFSN